MIIKLRPISTSTPFILGTAMWGWTVQPKQCYALLDKYYELGGRTIDCATNYPINKNANDFRAAEQILADWIKSNTISDIKIMMKIGSVNNLFTPEHNLTPSFLLLSTDYYQNLYDSNLDCLMIHWDNRDQIEEIEASLEVLMSLQESGLKFGLSGIKHPHLYQQILSKYKPLKLVIQAKHNLTYSDLQRYEPLHEFAHFIAYGVSGGGLKLNEKKYGEQASLLTRGGVPQKYASLVDALNLLLAEFKSNADGRPVPESMYHLGILYAHYHPLIKGVLLGGSKPQHLTDSWSWLQSINKYDYNDLYGSLTTIATLHSPAS